ncbi:hypothetical protein L9F63_014326 [Diploptera punctata]|uniref:Uncharacterized protein n=1 Tax=Diploptera punctata TaxID=6984 RepID=A0AAD8A874_DIPPU|nr:hypothetical protein L9F63_014326 [Diploptera punctata]
MQPLVIAVLVVLAVGSTSGQFFQPFVQSQSLAFNIQPPPLQQQHFFPQQQVAHSSFDHNKRALAHRAVVQNAEAEARLPPSLQNPFYKNPQIEAALAKESWFTPGEQQVKEREAEKIPRQKIYSILKHAGFIQRR